NPQAVVVYARAWRIVEALLRILVGGGLLYILLTVLVADDPPVTPPLLYRMFALFVVLPLSAASIIRRACSATMTIDRQHIVLRGKAVAIDVPRDGVAAARAWSLPLPGPGVSLRMRSGNRFDYGIQVDDPTRLMKSLDSREVSQQPTVAYACARARRRPRRWHHFVGRYVLFALPPAAMLFYTHQYIAYGGPLGEYYQLGLPAYLTTLTIYWSTLILYLILYATAWRAAVESVCLATAWLATPHVDRVRRSTELLAQIGYYGGVPLFLGLRYLP
ncbi:MAG: hypothetical protein HY270_16810, partial [Deltaproteobacteria bacterium]|nr:hypothetical protein [Deltaproteobacteria bacterium]